MNILRFILISVVCSSFLYANDNLKEGNSVGNSLLNYFRGNMDLTINSPISNGSQLQTVDGTQSGNANISCSGENSKIEYMEIEYTSGVSGINITISIDKNYDGIKESKYNFSGVTGICASGFVKNNPLLGLSYYQWEVNNGNVTTKEIFNSESISCYDITKGGISTSQKQRILQDIGGGISSYFTSSEQFIISGATYKNSSLVYYGETYNNCSNAGSINVTRDSDLASMTQSEASSQSLNENSVYSVFEKGSDNMTKLDKETQSAISGTQANVEDSLKYNQNNFSYSYTSDGQKMDNHYQAEDVKIQYCEVLTKKVDTTIFTDGTTRGESTDSNVTLVGDIRECTNNYTTCPVDTSKGESIKHNCGPIDNFEEAIGVLSGVEEAVGDMVCTTR